MSSSTRKTGLLGAFSSGRELSDLHKRVESLERRLAETEPTPNRRN
jgi:hypothetical protein